MISSKSDTVPFAQEDSGNATIHGSLRRNAVANGKQLGGSLPRKMIEKNGTGIELAGNELLGSRLLRKMPKVENLSQPPPKQHDSASRPETGPNSETQNISNELSSESKLEKNEEYDQFTELPSTYISLSKNVNSSRLKINKVSMSSITSSDTETMDFNNIFKSSAKVSSVSQIRHYQTQINSQNEDEEKMTFEEFLNDLKRKLDVRPLLYRLQKRYNQMKR
jgi:hypothetical protein